MSPAIAYVTGDDLLPIPELLGEGHRLANLDTGETLAQAGIAPLTAHAYLGGLPIAQALRAGADIVITGRVTDAALVVGPGMWRFGWGGDDLDALAGAVVTGHVLECGCQATGGNYAFFLKEVNDLAHAGFPLAELAADGSSVITKHQGTGGLVSVGTVTAQLLYEIGPPAYANPDVIARFDTIALEQVGRDRVRVSEVRGERPPTDLKVALNYAGGYRNSMALVLEGLDIAAKAELAEQTIWARIPGGKESFDAVDVDLARPTDPALLRISVLDQDKAKVGRAFSAAVIETGLASYPGFYALSPPGDASAYGVYWPTLIPADLVTTTVVIDGELVWTGPARSEPGQSVAAGPEQQAATPPAARAASTAPTAPSDSAETASARGDDLPEPPAPAVLARGDDPPEPPAVVRMPLGAIAGARSGDKGGNANLGVWVRTPAEYAWLERYLTADRLADLGRRPRHCGPANRAVLPAEPARRQHRDRRPARPRGGGEHQARPSGQGARRGAPRRAGRPASRATSARRGSPAMQNSNTGVWSPGGVQVEPDTSGVVRVHGRVYGHLARPESARSSSG